MKKKNGFISTAIVYSFFFVFLMMLTFIVNDYSTNRTMLNNLKRDVKTEISDTNFLRYLINHSNDPSFGLVRHNEELPNGAMDSSYRYVGANPNNYVCLTSNAVPCPAGNMYRIIGIIDSRIKVVKNTSIGTIAWEESVGVDSPSVGPGVSWVNTTLLNYLNTTFLPTLGDFQKYIVNLTWNTGGVLTTYGLGTVYNAYSYEVGLNKNDSYVTNKIGLLYLSDYGYAASNSYWTYNLSAYSAAKSGNWLDDAGLNEWIMTANKNNINQAYYIASNGNVSTIGVTTPLHVRPVFYLDVIMKRTGGSGTVSDPYRLG